MNVKCIVEAALFSASEGLRISEIAEKTGLPEEDVRTAVLDLRREYEERGSAIQIAKIDAKYKMTLRSEYSGYTGAVTKAELAGGVLKTLITIAYNQPVLQSKLFKARGPRTYEDVPKLVEMGFVSAKKAGQTVELTTTGKFSEYFGIGSTKVKDIRAWIESQGSGPSE